MRRAFGILVKLGVGFVALSLLLVVLYRFVPVPVTATMLMDERGITKDWEPLANIDRNLVRAVIAAEDGKFCTHNGFDREAIEQAIERNKRGKRLRRSILAGLHPIVARHGHRSMPLSRSRTCFSASSSRPALT